MKFDFLGHHGDRANGLQPISGDGESPSSGTAIQNPKDSDSFRTTIYCGDRYVLELRPSFRQTDLADRIVGRGQPDGYVRETFSLLREDARARAKAFLRSYLKAAYMSEVERWRELPGGSIEFIMRTRRTRPDRSLPCTTPSDARLCRHAAATRQSVRAKYSRA